jgi:hypothetical protein
VRRIPRFLPRGGMITETRCKPVEFFDPVFLGEPNRAPPTTPSEFSEPYEELEDYEGLGPIQKGQREHFEREVLSDPARISQGVTYARDVIGGTWPEWETRALQLAPHHPHVLDAAVHYARVVRGRRWEELEPLILQAFVDQPVACTDDVEGYYELYTISDSIWNYLEVHDGRWIEWEPLILRCAADNPDLLHVCLRYAKERLLGRWSQLEALLLEAILMIRASFIHSGQDGVPPEWFAIYDYLENFIKGPWPELETSILTHGLLPEYGVGYAASFRKKRWPELENRMLVLDKRFSFEEQVSGIIRYANELVGGAWPEAENFFMTECRSRRPAAASYAAFRYAREVIRGRWIPGEDLLSGSSYWMRDYAMRILESQLPPKLHQEMAMKSFENTDDRHIKEYFRWCAELARTLPAE